MRLCKDSPSAEQAECAEFSKFVLSIGDGILSERNESCGNKLNIPDKYIFNNGLNKTLKDFILWCYPELQKENPFNNQNNNADDDIITPQPLLHERAILCPLNTDADYINKLAIDMFSCNDTNAFILRSADTIMNDNGEEETNQIVDMVVEFEHNNNTNNQNHHPPPQEMGNFTQEYLNSLVFSGVPPHEIVVKPNVTIMLLRNLDTKNGLCNGTKLTYLSMKSQFLMVAKIIGGIRDQEVVLIPRINFVVSETKLPFTLIRRQFPVKLAFGMTINKSQGQSLKRVGIYLPKPVFSHGQLYVAIGRSGLPKETKLYIVEDEATADMQGKDSKKRYFTQNVVWDEVLK